MLVVTCRCGHNMKVPAGAMGKACKCVKCAERITITAANTRPMQQGVMRTKPLPPEAAGGEPSKGGGEPARSPGDKRVGQLLIEAGLIDDAKLQEALRVQAERGGKLFEVLITLGHLGKDDLHVFLSKQSGVPAIDLRNYEIPRDLISLVPKVFAQEHIVLPIDKLGRLLTVGMACPLDSATIAELERVTGLKVKAMLCRFDDIYAAIKNYYPPDPAAEPAQEPEQEYASFTKAAAPAAAPVAQPAAAVPSAAVSPVAKPLPPAVKHEELLARIENLDSLPTMPETLRRLQDAEEHGLTIREIAGLAGADPALTVRMLALANSSAYGVGDVTNINYAAVMLGNEGIRRVAEGLAATEMPEGFDHQAFWVRSMFCAAAAMSIAKSCGKAHVPDAYSAGLIHEIGALVLAVLFPDIYAKVRSKVSDNASAEALLNAEDEVFGFTHPEVGYLLVRQWRMPDRIAHSLRYHHQPSRVKGDGDLFAVVTLAVAMLDIHEMQAGPETEPFKPVKHVLAALSVDENEAWRILHKTADTLKAAVGA